MHVNRRGFLACCSALGLSGTLFPGALYARIEQEDELTTETIAYAEQLAGLRFTEAQRELMLEDLKERLALYDTLREIPLPNAVMPAQVFDPRIGGVRPPEGPVVRLTAWTPPAVSRPARDEDLAYMTVAALAGLLKSRQVTATELTELYLSRLKRYDATLQAVITLTEERAREQAAQADRELAAGTWRGPLHGIPWGAKDLFAVQGYPTTWGAMPYRSQQFDHDAAVVERLDAAGAVLVAKLSLGALAWGDVWFGGKTKNPWNVEQGSSGSSAGPAAAVAAGMVGFAIGSETLGSIVSPATRTGVTGLRPTFGRVSRHGAMALSWSMDKLGPMCRSAEDCALVFDVLHGRDERDPTTLDVPFSWAPGRASSLRVGYVADAFDGDYANRDADGAVLDVLRAAGYDLLPVSLPEMPVEPLLLTLNAEAAAAFDDLSRSGAADTMVRQERNAWPNVFRHARFIPAVEYIQANRARTLLMQAMTGALEKVDVLVAPSFRGGALRITNLTGHPTVVVPDAFHPPDDQPTSPRRAPGSISFVGGLYQDDAALAVAHVFQQATDFHRRRPPMQ